MATKILKFLAAIALMHYVVVAFIPYGELINAAIYLFALWKLINEEG